MESRESTSIRSGKLSHVFGGRRTQSRRKNRSLCRHIRKGVSVGTGKRKIQKERSSPPKATRGRFAQSLRVPIDSTHRGGVGRRAWRRRELAYRVRHQ